MNKDTMIRDENKAKYDGFAEWLTKPETKYFISKLPPSEDPDLVRTVLEFAFRAGFDSGSGFVAVTMASSLVEAMRKRDDR